MPRQSTQQKPYIIRNFTLVRRHVFSEAIDWHWGRRRHWNNRRRLVGRYRRLATQHPHHGTGVLSTPTTSCMIQLCDMFYFQRLLTYFLSCVYIYWLICCVVHQKLFVCRESELYLNCGVPVLVPLINSTSHGSFKRKVRMTFLSVGFSPDNIWATFSYFPMEYFPCTKVS